MRSISYIVCLLLAIASTSAQKNKGWWKDTVFYQVYPRSFQDSNGDGIGDLNGITSKLEYFKDSGIGAIWLSPINKSPMSDFGYDISDFTDIDEIFGNLTNFKELLQKAKRLGLKVILDLVPNHTSDQHYWFQMSLAKTGKYSDYYIWHDGKKESNGTRVPPNNWKSVFNGSAWTWNDTRKQYYFHQFKKEQPDLNYDNEDVQNEMKNIIRFWMDLGVDGFRIDAVPHLFESNITQDEPPSNISDINPDDHLALIHTLTKDQPKTYELIKSWREFVDKYVQQNQQEEKVLMTEAYTTLNNTVKYYEYGADVPFNFKFITDATAASSATDFKNIIDKWMSMMPKGGVANWVMGNHDRVRLETRYPGRGDQMTMLAMILPGVAVTYYGEEIGMEDEPFTKIIYDFRDGCRTPFQWDDSTSAGFSTNATTWLPVHKNYKQLNLKKENEDVESHYKVYKGLIKLRQTQALKQGSLETSVAKESVLMVVRKITNEAVTLLLNFKNETVKVDLSNIVKGKNTKVYLSNVGADLKQNTTVTSTDFSVPPRAGVVLHSSIANVATYSMPYLLLMMFISLFRS